MEIEQFPEGRYYNSPIGYLPSVTTVLKAYQNNTYLDKWRKKIGDEAADAIVEKARVRGNIIHEMADKFLNNRKDWDKDVADEYKQTFAQISPILEKNIEVVYGCEIPLYSRQMRIAGTTDAVVVWGGNHSIVDFKTSKKPVSDTSDKLRFYKLQTVIYAMMVFERYGIDCEYSHILIMIDDSAPKIVSFRNTAFRTVARELIEKVVIDISPKS